jgi:tetratricopeptide (TPR) repeat protein
MSLTTEYNRLLAASTLRDLPAPTTLEHVGRLVDLAHAHRDAGGAEHAIALVAELQLDSWSSRDRAHMLFFLANAWDDLARVRAKTDDERWTWSSAEKDASLLALRRAVAEDGFAELSADVQCKILTNLGNAFSTIGRYIEAVEYWNAALAVDPSFPMALANRGYGRFHYAKTLYDEGHCERFLRAAYQDLQAGVPSVPYPDAKEYFTFIAGKIEERYGAEFLRRPDTYRDFSLGGSEAEVAYRTWTLRERLFLNPMNDLDTASVAATDVLHTPSMVVPAGEPPILQGFFNAMKQEYTAARFLLWQGLHTQVPAFADRDVYLMNTLDYPAYGVNGEYLKLAFRSFYSLFDKIAFFLNRYLRLGTDPNRVYFARIWYEGETPKKGLKPIFERYANLPLRGLFWLSRDFDDRADRQLASDAELLSTVRQHLEHKYLKVHTDDWSPGAGGEYLTDTLAHSIREGDFERKTLRLARLTRAALIYLILGVHVEEQHRREKRPSDIVIPGTSLDRYEDEWKR